MATLSDIKKQIASLEKQAAALLKEAASEAAKKAAALIKQHGLTAADVGLAPKPGKAATVKKAVAADPKGVGYIEKAAVDGSVKAVLSLD